MGDKLDEHIEKLQKQMEILRFARDNSKILEAFNAISPDDTYYIKMKRSIEEHKPFDIIEFETVEGLEGTISEEDETVIDSVDPIQKAFALERHVKELAVEMGITQLGLYMAYLSEEGFRYYYAIREVLPKIERKMAEFRDKKTNFESKSHTITYVILRAGVISKLIGENKKTLTLKLKECVDKVDANYELPWFMWGYDSEDKNIGVYLESDVCNKLVNPDGWAVNTAFAEYIIPPAMIRDFKYYAKALIAFEKSKRIFELVNEPYKSTENYEYPSFDAREFIVEELGIQLKPLPFIKM